MSHRSTAAMLVAAVAVVAAGADVAGGDPPPQVPTIGDGAQEATPARPFGRVSPDDIESAIQQRIAQSGVRMTALTSVECDTLRCRVVFSGLDPNPRTVGVGGAVMDALLMPPWNDYQPTQASAGTREISPGAREHVIELTYVALVEESDDPVVAARQHAACAGAWTRVTELRGSHEYLRHAHAQAAKHLEIAARTLGLEEARRVADELEFGPLTRDCHAMPY